ncbi:MAG: tetratricopeptide repeat protein [Myxococcota bacterium]|jgi:tetratricopeptide (TPR) repeat protein|nr:tetratricopeptide repeat protein [Myxococcota bacterium]
MTQRSIEELLNDATQAAQDRLLEYADELIAQVLEREPENLRGLDLLGFVRYFQGDPKAAEEACRKALAIEPEHAYAHKGLGLCLAKQGQVEQGLEHLRHAIELRPKWMDPRWDLTVTLIQAQRFEEAEANLSETETAFPAARARLAGLRKHLEKARQSAGQSA